MCNVSYYIPVKSRVFTKYRRLERLLLGKTAGLSWSDFKCFPYQAGFTPAKCASHLGDLGSVNYLAA